MRNEHNETDTPFILASPQTGGVSLVASAALVALAYAAPTAADAWDLANYSFASETIASVPIVPSAIPTAAERESWRDVHAAVRSTPFENGMDHPAERSLTGFIERFGSEALTSLTQEWQNGAPGQFATLLRLVGRLSGIDHYTRRALVSRGLSSSDSDVRDAAIQCVEVSQAADLISDLRAHDEPDPFIREYRDGVIDDLTG